MPNELPAFLQEFMKHRQHVTKKDPTPADKKHAALTSVSKTKQYQPLPMPPRLPSSQISPLGTTIPETSKSLN